MSIFTDLVIGINSEDIVNVGLFLIGKRNIDEWFGTLKKYKMIRS